MPAPAEGFPAAAQSTALRAACSIWAAGCAAPLQPGAQGCPADQVPAVPQGLCCLPGSALSPPRELPRALRGDVSGEGAPSRAGQGMGLLLPQLLHPRALPWHLSMSPSFTKGPCRVRAFRFFLKECENFFELSTETPESLQ